MNLRSIGLFLLLCAIPAVAQVATGIDVLEQQNFAPLKEIAARHGGHLWPPPPLHTSVHPNHWACSPTGSITLERPFQGFLAMQLSCLDSEEMIDAISFIG